MFCLALVSAVACHQNAVAALISNHIVLARAGRVRPFCEHARLGKVRGRPNPERYVACHASVSRGAHNSYQQELHDKEASEVVVKSSPDDALAPYLQRIADACKLDAQTSVLDVATGTGVMLPFYKEKGVSMLNVVGVDLSAGMLEHARERYTDATFFQKDICNFEDPEGRLFDRVVFNACYGHIHDPETALRHVTEELISGGGLIVISEPRGKAWLQEAKKSDQRAILHSMPSKSQLQKLITKLGGSGSVAVFASHSPLLSVECVHDEDDFYCAVLRRSWADF